MQGGHSFRSHMPVTCHFGANLHFASCLARFHKVEQLLHTQAIPHKGGAVGFLAVLCSCIRFPTVLIAFGLGLQIGLWGMGVGVVACWHTSLGFCHQRHPVCLGRREDPARMIRFIITTMPCCHVQSLRHFAPGSIACHTQMSAPALFVLKATGCMRRCPESRCARLEEWNGWRSGSPNSWHDNTVIRGHVHWFTGTVASVINSMLQIIAGRLRAQ